MTTGTTDYFVVSSFCRNVIKESVVTVRNQELEPVHVGKARKLPCPAQTMYPLVKILVEKVSVVAMTTSVQDVVIMVIVNRSLLSLHFLILKQVGLCGS